MLDKQEPDSDPEVALPVIANISPQPSLMLCNGLQLSRDWHFNVE